MAEPSWLASLAGFNTLFEIQYKSTKELTTRSQGYTSMAGVPQMGAQWREDHLIRTCLGDILWRALR